MNYVMSDIHGQYGLYRQMLKEIGFTAEDTLYVLGDVIDRGPESIPLLKDIMRRENVVMFLGNHELMMLDHLSQAGDYPNAWVSPGNGGEETLNALRALPEDEQKEILLYIRSSWLQKYVTVGGERYGLHHSYFLPWRKQTDVRYSDVEDWQIIFDTVWNSPWRLWEYADPEQYKDGCTHIIGHVPVQAINSVIDKPPFVLDNIINIDGGCALLPKGYPGGLYCMSLEKDKNGKRREFWISGEPAEVEEDE